MIMPLEIAARTYSRELARIVPMTRVCIDAERSSSGCITPRQGRDRHLIRKKPTHRHRKQLRQRLVARRSSTAGAVVRSGCRHSRGYGPNDERVLPLRPPRQPESGGSPPIALPAASGQDDACGTNRASEQEGKVGEKLFTVMLRRRQAAIPYEPRRRFWKLFDAREAKLTKNSKIQNPYTVSRLAELTAATRTHLKEHRLQAAVIDCWISDRDHVLVLHLDPSRGLRLACIQ